MKMRQKMNANEIETKIEGRNETKKFDKYECYHDGDGKKKRKKREKIQPKYEREQKVMPR